MGGRARAISALAVADILAVLQPLAIAVSLTSRSYAGKDPISKIRTGLPDTYALDNTRGLGHGPLRR